MRFACSVKPAGRPVLLLALLVAAILFPQMFGSALVTQIAVFTLVYAVMATAWNILAGYTGYVSLGHAAFFGIGAYSLGLICQHWSIPGGYGPFFLLPVVGLIAAAMAIPLGLITLRTRRHVFVVLTIAMLFIGQLLAFNLRDITNGSSGLAFPFPTWTGASFNLPFYYATLILLLVALLTSWWMRSSKLGLELLAVRDDEDRAVGLGVPAAPLKLFAFVVAAFFIAMAGGIYGYFIAYIYPANGFNPLDDLAMALMTFAGGLGTLPGPIIGALVIEPAHEYFAFEYGASDLYLVLYGALFLVIILLMPRGIWPAVQGRLAWLRERRRLGSPPAAALEEPIADAKRVLPR
jgi:branched-chain amino acid transport system permease protein